MTEVGDREQSRLDPPPEAEKKVREETEKERQHFARLGIELPPFWDSLNASQKEMFVQMDSEQRKHYISWYSLKLKTQDFEIRRQELEAPEPTVGAVVGKVQSVEEVASQKDYDPTDEVIVPVSSRIIKDSTGAYIAQQSFRTKKVHLAKGPRKTFAFNIDDLIVRIYKKPFIEDGKLGLVTAKKQTSLSHFPVKITKDRAERLLAFSVYLLNRESSQEGKKSKSRLERIRLSEGVRKYYSELEECEAKGFNYISELEAANGLLGEKDQLAPGTDLPDVEFFEDESDYEQSGDNSIEGEQALEEEQFERDMAEEKLIEQDTQSEDDS